MSSTDQSGARVRHRMGKAGLSVRYTTAALVNEFAEAATARRLSSVIARYSKADCESLITGQRH